MYVLWFQNSYVRLIQLERTREKQVYNLNNFLNENLNHSILSTSVNKTVSFTNQPTDFILTSIFECALICSSIMIP